MKKQAKVWIAVTTLMAAASAAVLVVACSSSGQSRGMSQTAVRISEQKQRDQEAASRADASQGLPTLIDSTTTNGTVSITPKSEAQGLDGDKGFGISANAPPPPGAKAPTSTGLPELDLGAVLKRADARGTSPGESSVLSESGNAAGARPMFPSTASPSRSSGREPVKLQPGTPSPAGDSLSARGFGRVAPAPAKDDELLIIERRKAEARDNQANATDAALGCGGMLTQVDQKYVLVPLKHTDVKGSISGYISAVTVTQQFTNPYSSKIEAVYTFPLPENAAVSEFVMTIGDRHIRGIIREREQAEQIYNQARAQGYTASLLTQERPNIFTQKVANIEPGKQIDVNITYYSTLAFSDGGYEFTFPMVIGPRFNPPGTTNGVGSVARKLTGSSGQSTEVQYLRPSERSGHDISLALDLDAGVSIEGIECRSHKVDIQRTGERRAHIALSTSDSIPNRDFILRWQVAGDSVKSAILSHSDSRGGYFTMMLVPPKDLSRTPRNPVEMVFVLDRSGSMSGVPMQQCQRAISRGLERLQPGDSFQIIDFAEDSSAMGPAPVEASAESIRKGQRYLATLDAQGGTYMVKGMNAALRFPHDPERLRFVAFCTDGFIGNESDILSNLHANLGASRIFSFGVGNCNRYLMDSMARMGSGLATYLSVRDSADTIMDTFFDRISHAPMSDLAIDWNGANVSEVYPSRTPDLFAGRPVVLTGRYKGEPPHNVRVSGRVGRERQTLTVAGAGTDDSTTTAALAQVWARTKLADLGDQQVWDTNNPELAAASRQCALDYSLLSAFTAFVAVDSSVKTAGAYGTTVPVAVPVPEGVRYETTVQER